VKLQCQTNVVLKLYNDFLVHTHQSIKIVQKMTTLILSMLTRLEAMSMSLSSFGSFDTFLIPKAPFHCSIVDFVVSIVFNVFSIDG